VDLKHYFDRVVLITLRRRSDRFAHAIEALRSCRWPFKEPDVFEAVDGHALPAPVGWQSGPGAWGCLRSHQRVLECAIADRVRRLLILEDDICFSADFASDVRAFLRSVPDDWDQLMIGGQHKTDAFGWPRRVNDAVYRCTSCERTHCYAVRGDFMRRLYQRWSGAGKFDAKVHCDWIMARDPEMQLQHKVYAPVLFLAGQRRDESDIMNRMQQRQFWNPPGPGLPVVHLRTPAAVAAGLREYGMHFGYAAEPDAVSNPALSKIIENPSLTPDDKITLLRDVIKEIQWEVASNPRLICAIWHPDATSALIRRASLWKVRTITARSVESALRQLPARLRSRSRLSSQLAG
jgi:GR25 family glycosyltransferase involved in LPS biosynthesis